MIPLLPYIKVSELDEVTTLDSGDFLMAVDVSADASVKITDDNLFAPLANIYVPQTRTINGHALSSNVTLTTSDISEGTNLYFTDERAQDAVGGIVDSTLVYNDSTPSIGRAAISGDITIASGSNTAAISSGVIVNADINASAAIDATKIAAGTVDNTEFGYLNGVTSAIQTQLNAKQGTLTLTTTGSSGPATLIGDTLNIPEYVSSGGPGTVTTVSVATANGFAGTVANPTTTPAITLTTSITGVLKGNGTAISAATAGTDYVIPSGSVATLTTGRTISISGDLTYTSPTFNGSANVTAAGTLATVNSNVGSFGSATQVGTFTVNAKGLITAASNTTVTPAVGSITGLGTGVATWLATPSSANLAAAVTGETGSGALVFGTSPTISGATLTTSSVNGVTLTTGGSSTTFLNGAGSYATPVSTPPAGATTATTSGATVILTVDFTTYISYRIYFNASSANGTNNWLLDGSSNGGGAYTTSTYIQKRISGTTVSAYTSGICTLNAAGDATYGYIDVWQDSTSGSVKFFMNLSTDGDSSGTVDLFEGAGICALSAACNRLRLSFSSTNNFDAGSITLVPTVLR